jgi:hypothetical protein
MQVSYTVPGCIELVTHWEKGRRVIWMRTDPCFVARRGKPSLNLIRWKKKARGIHRDPDSVGKGLVWSGI